MNKSHPLVVVRVSKKTIPGAARRGFPFGRSGGVQRRAPVAGQRPVWIPSELGQHFSRDQIQRDYDGERRRRGPGGRRNSGKPVRHLVQLRAGTRPAYAPLSHCDSRLRLPLGRHPQGKFVLVMRIRALRL